MSEIGTIFISLAIIQALRSFFHWGWSDQLRFKALSSAKTSNIELWILSYIPKSSSQSKAAQNYMHTWASSPWISINKSRPTDCCIADLKNKQHLSMCTHVTEDRQTFLILQYTCICIASSRQPVKLTDIRTVVLKCTKSLFIPY